MPYNLNHVLYFCLNSGFLWFLLWIAGPLAFAQAAANPVTLSEDWLAPTRESEEGDGGNVQNPIEGETWIEFHNFDHS